MTQYLLRQSNRHRVCWLKVDSLKPGTELTLKDEAGRWTVVQDYAPRLQAIPEHRWLVGGLRARAKPNLAEKTHG